MTSEKHKVLQLLEKVPDCEKDADEWAKWYEEIKEEINNLLGFWEKDLEEELEDIRDELAEIKDTIRLHKHVDGVVVEPVSL